MIKLPGVKGETDPRTSTSSCMEMYDVIYKRLEVVQDPGAEDMGRKYWKKRSYIFQGFVVDDPLKEDSQPENPIRRFIIGPQIFQLIKAALMDPDMEELPTDYTAGVDFRLAKGSKGGYADYGASNWARRERPLGDSEMAAINNHGLFNLNDFLPKKPGEVEVKVLTEMFEASVDGEAYDPDKWSQYFRPAGMQARTGDPNASAPKATPAPATPVAETKTDTGWKEPAQEATPEPAPAPAPEAAPAEEAGGAQDILAMIRARQNQ